jgi:eukaryotic-like serine/threonine-protein kinase
MGEVYRARDAKLGRDVALKVLPGDFANDAQRMARFEREAQLLAALNHPNIAAIYGLDESGAVRALVMELVEGPMLADRIARGPLPLDEALPIAKQIAEALEYAHERGIIHRDLKPANIKITPDGVVKILDFGLAKAVAEDPVADDPSNSPTISAAASKAGMILGTAAYMSPEQAKGKAADKRADIWAFGVVLYEMLTAKRLFSGEATSEVLAAVMLKDPKWEAIPKETPSRLLHLLRRCLTKDPQRRLRDIGEARIEIEEVIAAKIAPIDSEKAAGAVGAPPASRLRRPALLALAAVVVALSSVAGWWFWGRRAPVPQEWSADLLGGSIVALGPRISPDGHTLAFQAMVDVQTQVGVMNPVTGNWTLLTHERSRGAVNEIAWSPDGSRLYYDRVFPPPVGIYSIPSLGGEERLVLEDSSTPEALPDGSLVILRVDPDQKLQIYHYWPDSGRLQALGAWPDLKVQEMMRVFPDGKEVVFHGTVKEADADHLSHLYAVDVATGKSRRLARDLPVFSSGETFALGVTPDNQSVLIDLPSGDLHRIVSIPRSGSAPARTLFSLTVVPWFLDAAADGSIYVDQLERPQEVLRFPVSGGAPEVLASTPAFPEGNPSSVELPDGRVLLPALFSGHASLLLGRPGGDFVPFVDTTEQTFLPATRVEGDEVAFVAGTGAERTIAVASVHGGRMLRRLSGTTGAQVDALAASPDGRTVYYAASGNIWEIPAADGTPRKVCKGDGVAPDPNGRDLVVTVIEGSAAHLYRKSLAGGELQGIQLQGNPRLAPVPIGNRAIGRDGRILVTITTPDFWFFEAAVVDPRSGRFTRIPLSYTGDAIGSNWASDGRILSAGFPLDSHIWRFRPKR